MHMHSEQKSSLLCLKWKISTNIGFTLIAFINTLSYFVLFSFALPIVKQAGDEIINQVYILPYFINEKELDRMWSCINPSNVQERKFHANKTTSSQGDKPL